MHIFTIILLATLLLTFSPELALAQQATISCYSCASSELKNIWAVTGLVQKTDSSFFYGSCAQSPENGASRESCSGPCMTWLFDNPDNLNTNNGGNTPLVVRGCHRTLTQVVSDRLSSISGNGAFCETDKDFKMSNSFGNVVTVKAMNEFCNYNECNGRSTSEFYNANNNHACSNETNDNLLNNASLYCYDCLPSEGNNCHESKCSKKYCLKQQVKLGGGYQLIKSCSNINIFGVDNYCQTYDVFTSQGGVPVKSQYSQCYCKDKQFCNSSQNISSFGTLMLILSCVILYC